MLYLKSPEIGSEIFSVWIHLTTPQETKGYDWPHITLFTFFLNLPRMEWRQQLKTGLERRANNLLLLLSQLLNTTSVRLTHKQLREQTQCVPLRRRRLARQASQGRVNVYCTGCPQRYHSHSHVVNWLATARKKTKNATSVLICSTSIGNPSNKCKEKLLLLRAAHLQCK